MNISDKKRRIILIICGAVLLVALIWTVIRGQTSELARVCDMLNEYGYNFIPDDITVLFDGKDTSVAEVLDSDAESLEAIVDASRSAGFPSDVNKKGSVTLLSVASGDGGIIFMYMTDGVANVCFTEYTDGTVLPVGAK